MTQESIDFDVAAREATLIAKARDIDHMRLGELGANVKTIYGGKTLNKLPQISGIKYASFKCYVAVYRAYDSEYVRLTETIGGTVHGRASRFQVNPVINKIGANGRCKRELDRNTGARSYQHYLQLDHADNIQLLHCRAETLSAAG